MPFRHSLFKLTAITFLISQSCIVNAGQWQPTNTGLQGGFINIIAPNPVNTNELFATSYYGYGGLYKSSDDAKTWVKVPGFDNKEITAIAYNPSNTQQIYVGTHSGLYKSVDGGKTWQPDARFKDMQIGTIVFAPVADPKIQRFYVGSIEKVYESISPNTSLKVVFDNSKNHESGYQSIVSSIAIKSMDNQVMLVGLDGFPQAQDATLYKTIDGGKHWKGITIKSDGYNINQVQQISFVSNQSNTVYLDGSVSLYQSTDNGDTWQSIFTMSQEYGYSSFVINANNPQEIFASYYDAGIYKTMNGGKTWRTVNGNFAQVNVTGVLVANIANTNLLYLGERVAGVQHSTDDGATWRSSGTGLFGFDLNLRNNGNANSPLTAFSSNMFVSRSVWQQQKDLSWVQLSIPKQDVEGEYISDVSIDPNNLSNILVSTDNLNWDKDSFDRAIYHTTDDGQTWQIKNGIELIGANIAIDPTSSLRFYGGGYDLNLSADGGVSWTTSSAIPLRYINQIIFNPANPDEMYAAGQGNDYNAHIAKSIDHGKTWGLLSYQFSPGQFSSMTIDPLQPNVLYVVTSQNTSNSFINVGTIFKSVDSGKTWNVISDPLPAEAIGAVVTDPIDPQTIYVPVGFNEESDQYWISPSDLYGVYVSHDGGVTWNPMNEGLDNLAVRTLAFSNGTLYASTDGAGVYAWKP